MRSRITAAFVFLALTITVQAQESVCLNDTVKLRSNAERGELFWQQSLNGSDWSRIPGASETEIELVPTESAFFRYEVLEGTCAAIYSDVLQVIVNLPPIVTLSVSDSVCVNADAFLLTTGSPVGGSYWGTGFVDGKFIPALAGVGTHTYFYAFTDSETSCADTANSIITVKPLPSEANAGNDFPEILQDSVQLSALAPEIGTGTWSVLSGSGGTFSDINDPQAWFHKGEEDVHYQLQWTVANDCGSGTDEIELTFLRLSKNPCPGTPVVFDADGNMYPTIQIGDQCWMGENLKVGITVASTETNRPHSDHADNGIIERYALFNDEANIDLYGGLYDWDEMMGYTEEEGVQGICPEGWHVPTLDEWDQLDEFYKDRDAGAKLKEGGESGFEGKLAGDRHNGGSFVSFESSGFFWSSSTYTYNGANEGWVREICYCTDALDRLHFHKKTGASVRCIKDSE